MKILYTSSGIRFLIVLILAATVSFTAYSQEKTISIHDKQSGQAIGDVYFTFGNQSGFSDAKGNIIINVLNGESLFLSHVAYGKISVQAEQLVFAIEDGILEIEEVENHLLPVTTVMVRPDAGKAGELEFTAEDKLAHDAGALLESVASVSSIRKSGAYGFDPVLRGFKYDQINLVLDGVQTATAACPNRMDPAASQIPINMISKAEVLKGPYSLRFGNVFGGTINFKSTEPDFKSKTTPLARIGSSYESNGNILRSEGVAGVSSSKIDFRVFGAYSKGDDYTDGEGIEIPSSFNRLNWGGKLVLKLGRTQKLGILVSNNIAKDVDFAALTMDLRKDDTWLVNANHSVLFYDKILSSWNTSVYGTFVDHLMDNYDKVLNPRTVDAITDASTLNYGGRTELRFDLVTSHLYAGLDYKFESADGFRTREVLMGPMTGKVFTDNVWQDAQVNKGGLFGEWHVNRPEFQFVLSGRVDYNSSKANNPDPRFTAIYDDLESVILHPSVSIGGTRLFNESLSLGLWMGVATRSPGITERYINQLPVGLDPYEMLGNPDLKQEMNKQFDLVFQYQTAATTLSLNGFTSFLKNYISFEIRDDLPPAMATAPGVRQFVNIDKALMSGFEINWAQAYGQYLKQDLSLAYTYGQNKTNDEALPEIAPMEFRYRITGNFVKRKLHPEITLRHAFKQDRIAISYGESETPAFSVVDAKVNWHFKSILTATGGVQNLFDVAYYEHLARSVRSADMRPIYSPGRSYYLTLTFKFM